MKKIVIAILAIFAMTSVASAQIETLGVRGAFGTAAGAELSAQWGMGSNRLETDLGWAGGPDWSYLNLSGIWQWKGEFGSGFGWFAGVGARVAYWSWSNGNNGDSDIALGLAGQAGIEYQFPSIPIQLSLDIRPCFYLIPETNFHWGDIALGIRYMF